MQSLFKPFRKCFELLYQNEIQNMQKEFFFSLTRIKKKQLFEWQRGYKQARE
jgi:hypothetical protein